MSRGQQVCSDVLRRRPAQWLALDDDTGNWPEWGRPNLVVCDGRTGLSDPRVQAELYEKLQWCVRELEKEAGKRRDELSSNPLADDAAQRAASPPQTRNKP
jgi:hypothetical protein